MHLDSCGKTNSEGNQDDDGLEPQEVISTHKKTEVNHLWLIISVLVKIKRQNDDSSSMFQIFPFHSMFSMV